MTLKEGVETFQAVVTTIAIIVGGFWTFNLFIKERQHYPHANIVHSSEHIQISNEINLLRINIKIKNTGSSQIFIDKSIVRVQQILPIAKCKDGDPCVVDQVNSALGTLKRTDERFEWPLLFEIKKEWAPQIDIEPNEEDEIDFEFVVPADIKSVRLYSYFKNTKKELQKEIGWVKSSYYTFKSKKGEEK